jgi:hypothetical protein
MVVADVQCCESDNSKIVSLADYKRNTGKSGATSSPYTTFHSSEEVATVSEFPWKERFHNNSPPPSLEDLTCANTWSKTISGFVDRIIFQNCHKVIEIHCRADSELCRMFRYPGLSRLSFNSIAYRNNKPFRVKFLTEEKKDNEMVVVFFKWFDNMENNTESVVGPVDIVFEGI